MRGGVVRGREGRGVRRGEEGGGKRESRVSDAHAGVAPEEGKVTKGGSASAVVDIPASIKPRPSKQPSKQHPVIGSIIGSLIMWDKLRLGEKLPVF